MKMEQFNNALNHIDYDLIDEFVREKDGVQLRKQRKRAFARITSVAACFALLLTATAAVIGYSAGMQKKSEFNSSLTAEQIFFEKDGKFVFEYKGKLYQAYVAPVLDNDDFADNGSVSIQNVGERITDVTVTDENGNSATMEIYANKSDSGSGDILLKLNGGYFRAQGVKLN